MSFFKNKTMDGSVETSELVKKLRQNISNLLKPHHDDAFLIRWLRAKNYDLKKAEKMLRHCLLVRETYQFDTITETYTKPEVCQKYEFIGFLGFDKEGTPIRYVAIGKGDYNGFVHCLNTIDIAVYCGTVIEQDLAALRQRRTKTVQRKNINDDVLVIFDFADFSLHNLAYRHVIETGFDLMRLLQDLHPPDVLKRVIIINAPIYFYAIFKVFKPILRHALIQRIQVCSRENSPTELLKLIDADVLPSFLGGKRTDKNGDPFCSAFIKPGGTIPDSYYPPANLQSFLNPNDHGVETMTVPARSTLDRTIRAEVAKKHFRLRFWSDGNIGLRVLYRPLPSSSSSVTNKDISSSSSNLKEHQEDGYELISPHATIQSHISPVDYLFTCPKAGIYLLRYDNTFSWVHSKKIIYKFDEVIT